MMKPLVTIIGVLLMSLLISSCSKDNPENKTEEVKGTLKGKIVFQNNTFQVSMTDLSKLTLKSILGNGMYNNRPVWSLDGLKVAFLNIEPVADAYTWNLLIYDTETSSQKKWELGSTKNFNLRGAVTWSPDGKTVAILGNLNFIMYVDVSSGTTITSPLNLTENTGFCSSIAWHPTTGMLALNISHLKNQIFFIDPYQTVIDFNHPDLTLNTGVMNGSVVFLDFSEDGQKIVYSEESYHSDIYVVNSDGTNEYKLPNVRGMAPCWSPSQEQIIFSGISGTKSPNFTIIPGLFVTDTLGSYKVELMKDASLSDWH